MKRGEVWWINFQSAIGGEIQKAASRCDCEQRRFKQVP